MGPSETKTADNVSYGALHAQSWLRIDDQQAPIGAPDRLFWPPAGPQSAFYKIIDEWDFLLSSKKCFTAPTGSKKRPTRPGRRILTNRGPSDSTLKRENRQTALIGQI